MNGLQSNQKANELESNDIGVIARSIVYGGYASNYEPNHIQWVATGMQKLCIRSYCKCVFTKLAS